MTQTAKIIQFSRPRMEQEDASAPDAGFIKLYRSLQDSAFSDRPEYFSAWIHILMLASHKPRKTMLGKKPVTLEAGQFVSGRNALADRVGVSPQTMRTIMSFFESEGMITRKSSRQGTVFTVVNYGLYHGGKGEEANQQSTNVKASCDEGLSDSVACSSTNDQPTINQQSPTQINQQSTNVKASCDEGLSDSTACSSTNGKSAQSTTTQEHNNISISNDIDNAHKCAAPDPTPPKRKPSAQKEFTTTLINKGVSKELAEEYAKVRKAKRLPLSEGALTLLEREAGKAGYTLASALETCVLRGWGGFKAQWLENDKQNSGRSGSAWIPDHTDTSWADGFRPFEEPF